MVRGKGDHAKRRDIFPPTPRYMRIDEKHSTALRGRTRAVWKNTPPDHILDVMSRFAFKPPEYSERALEAAHIARNSDPRVVSVASKMDIVGRDPDLVWHGVPFNRRKGIPMRLVGESEVPRYGEPENMRRGDLVACAHVEYKMGPKGRERRHDSVYFYEVR